MLKHELRKMLLQQRDAMSSEEICAKSDVICENLKEFTHNDRCKTVMVYLPTGNETDIWPLIKELLARGTQVVAPVCVEIGVMEPCLIEDLEKDLVPGPYGILAPLELRKIPLKEIDMVIVPGVAFDKGGNRLGFGAGYYDRFLPRLREDCRKVAICYGFQIRDDLRPEPHDFPVDAVVTEEGIIKVH